MNPCLPRLILPLVCASVLSAQQKKILVFEDSDFARELQQTGSQAKIVPVSNANVMEQLPDADAFIGNITSAQVRAGKNLKCVGVMSAGMERVLFPVDGSDDLRQSHNSSYEQQNRPGAGDRRSRVGHAAHDVAQPQHAVPQRCEASLESRVVPWDLALWRFENVVTTPHIAGRLDRDEERMTNTIKENLTRFVAGKPFIKVVDGQKGY